MDLLQSPDYEIAEDKQVTSAEFETLSAFSRNNCRPSVGGKFVFTGSEKFHIKGVSYGAFKPDETGREYQNSDKIRDDFKMIVQQGFNVVRIPHTVPPRELLDIAADFGLRIMVGLSAEQYLGYMIDGKHLGPIYQDIREKVRPIAGHPSLLCYALGNEIPAPLARWLGAKRIERYLNRLYDIVKSEDHNGLVTYVNYPTTEYLELPFLDFVCFNVYLESKDKLEAYIARLHNIAGERPLVLSEVGLDSLRNGEEEQARTLEWQVRTSLYEGCAGVVIFSWTDEWYRGGGEVDDWAFGLTDRNRNPKPALASLRNVFSEYPFPGVVDWPRISVVVCSYNGQRTIKDTCEGLLKVTYPDFEVIVVDDGSTDDTAAIARNYGFWVASCPNQGLSRARNVGMELATGEIVAYLDDDAYPDPHWLHYLAIAFMTKNYAAVGGPNILPRGDGLIAECVSNSPGGPAHILYSDRIAEHIPGCNMAFRKEALQKINGFDPQFRAAGDDVDVCWRIQENGGTIGFSHAAVIWHHRRSSVKAYWKQQLGYGRAEAKLERKWPEKFNSLGHLTWGGRVYYKGLTVPLMFRSCRIYQGVWGTAPFQSRCQPTPNTLASCILMPEWYMVVGLFFVLSLVGLVWKPLGIAFILFFLSLGAVILQAILSARCAVFTTAVPLKAKWLRRGLHTLTALLHLIQPLARLSGRITYGLTFWRRSGPIGYAFPRRGQKAIWTENWIDPIQRIHNLANIFQSQKFVVKHGGDYDDWDLEIRSGMFGAVRILTAVEDHGSGTQYVRYKWYPTLSHIQVFILAMLAGLGVVASIDRSWISAIILAGGAALISGSMLRQCSCAIAGVQRTMKMVDEKNA